MANITQTIPALTAGISQQPDEQKIPGQVKDMVNALPDVSQGLLKRPAGKFVASLSDGTNTDGSTRTKLASSDGKWFHYYRDENEQYIGQIHRDGTVRMWNCQTGDEKNVVDGIGYSSNDSYLKHNDDEDIQTLTLNDFTYLNNRSVTTSMDTGVSGTYHQIGSNVTITIPTGHGKSVGDLVNINYTSGNGSLNPSLPGYTVATTPNATTFTFTHPDPQPPSTVNEQGNVTVTFVEPLGDFGKEIFVELKSISYSKQYALNVFDTTTTQEVSTATRISVELIKSSNNYCTSTGGMSSRTVRVTNTTRCDNTAGDGRDAFAPNVGTKIFNVRDNSFNTSGVTDQVDIAISGTHNYDVFVKALDSNGAEVGVNRGKNLYFRIATTGQSVPYTTGSGSSQETTYQARYTTTHDLLHGGEGWQEGDFFYVWMKDGYYKVTIEATSTSQVQANLALVRPNPTPFDTETTITAESILGDIRKGITGSATASTGNGFTIKQIGNGLHIKRDAVFNASTPVSELLNVVAGKVQDVGDLPTQCSHGMVLEVVNSNADEDNHFVKFFGNNDRDGEGTWEECAKPGRTIRLKRSKMPVVLIRTADGNFRLSELDGSSFTVHTAVGPGKKNAPQWDDAICGDDVTNPEPSFVGKTINKMLFFRNRFCILSDEYIVMSRPGDFTNFFAKSAIVQIASDPIDISASSEYPAILYDGIQVNTGLVLFSKNQQFMLTTDSDTFSPLTAKINALSTYNFNFKTNPISLGTTIGFLDNAGKFSRFFEMTQVQREGEPEIIEQSAVVSRLFEKDLKLISNSRENSVIFFSEENTSTLYGYRYFDNVRERKLASWFKWKLTGTIEYHCMQDDFLYVVVSDNSKYQILKFSIKMDSDTFAIAENRVHLDHMRSTNGWDYNELTNKSSKLISSFVGLENTGQLAVYDSDSGNQLGRYALVTTNVDKYEIDGDWSNETFLIGYLYTMEIKLPTIYYVSQVGESFRADTRANTILHRVKFGFGPLGIYQTVLSRTGRTDFTETFEIASADKYKANAAGFVDDNILRTFPIYDRNINAALSIKSTHPSPATIHNMTWEGVYTNNNYERV